MYRGAATLGLALVLAVQPFGLAAQTPEPPQAAIMTLDQEQLFTATKYGQAMQAKIEAEAAALVAENRKIDAALEAEERDLTSRRATMDNADFAPLATAFDTKANELRAAQEAKSRSLNQLSETQRQEFFRTIGPIIGDYMLERGAVAVLDKSAVIVSLGSVDITKEVVTRIDTTLGDGTAAATP